MALVALLVLGALAAGCGRAAIESERSATPVTASEQTPAAFAADSGLGLASDIIARFQGARFVGHVSESDAVAPRWVGHRTSDRASVEIVGAPVATEVTVIVVAGARGTRLARQVLNTYAPGSTSVFDEVMAAEATDLERDGRFGDRDVIVDRDPVSSGARVTVTVRART